MNFDRINPISGEIASTAAAMSPDDARAVADRAAVALVGGNAVILKASEMCPRTHGLIIESFVEAGFPPRRGEHHHQSPGRCG
jgi:hypothetical protein